MPSSAYALIREAIQNKQQVTATYGGYLRELCPHAIGLGPSGNEQALFYQFGGYSSRGEAKDLPEADGWRCLAVDGLSDLSVRDGDWYTGDNHSVKNSCIKDLDLEVDY